MYAHSTTYSIYSMFHTVAQPASSTAVSVGRARNVHIHAPLPILPPSIILTHPVIFVLSVRPLLLELFAHTELKITGRVHAAQNSPSLDLSCHVVSFFQP